MTVPCSECPFRKEGGIRLTIARVRELTGMMLDSQGGTFPCHKTVDHSNEDEQENDTGSRTETEGEIHCAGALIFAEKNGNATQMMRIMERLRAYDHTKFAEETRALVFDTVREMIATNKKAYVKRKG